MWINKKTVTEDSRTGCTNTSDSFVPISQSARYLDPGYDISRKYEDTNQVEMQYYVYTKGRMDAAFATIQEAVGLRYDLRRHDYDQPQAGDLAESRKSLYLGSEY